MGAGHQGRRRNRKLSIRPSSTMGYLTDNPIYHARALPDYALDRGGVEMLRAGIVDEELVPTARRAFDDPAHWGALLADVVRRLATIYAAETKRTEAAVSATIANAFRAALAAGAAERAMPQGSEEPALPARRAGAKARGKPVAKSPKAAKSAGLDKSPARKTARGKS